MPRSLVVKVTCGAEDPERLNQGFTVAAAAAASGAAVFAEQVLGDGVQALVY